VAVRLEGRPGLAAALRERAAVVDLSGLDRTAQAGVLGRARVYVGSFGVEACLALLLGRPAAIVDADGVDADQLRVAAVVADRTGGRIETLDAAVGGEEAADAVLRLVEGPVGTLAAV
jgi:hypothetical protein